MAEQSAATVVLNETGKRIWEALSDSMDAFVVQTGKRRPMPATAWDDLHPLARQTFLVGLGDTMDDLMVAMMAAHMMDAVGGGQP